MPASLPDGAGDGPEPSQDQIATGRDVAAARRRFRHWRRTRPFWAGLWTLLGGAVIAWIPLSDTGRFLNAGQVAMTTVLPGIVLIVAGLFLWFSPVNRMLAGVIALVFAVASLVISNLGGFGLGMLLGIIGGSMALGWTDEPRRPRRRRPAPGTGRAAAVIVAFVVIALSLPVDLPVAAEDAGDDAADTLPMTVADLLDSLAAGVDELTGVESAPIDEVLSALAAIPEPVTDLADLINRLLNLLEDTADGADLPFVGSDPEPRPPEPTDGAPARSPTARTAAFGHDAEHVAPSLVSGLQLATLETTSLTYAGTVTHPTANGSVEVIRFVIDRIEATGLDLSLPSGQSAIADLANREGGTVVGTDVVLDCIELSLNITGVQGVAIPEPLSALLNVPLTLRPGSPELAILGPALDLLPAGVVLVTEDVDIDLITLSAAEITLLGLGGSAR